VRLLRISLLASLATLAATGPPATAALEIGLGDQRAQMFLEPLYRQLHTGYARLVVPWDVALHRGVARDRAALWIARALRVHVQPHVAFDSARLDRRGRPAAAATIAYGRAFRAFRRRWPDVHVFTPWNEVNRSDQPTLRNPRLAATYYDIMRRNCRQCTVVGADLLDTPNIGRWLPGFERALRVQPRLWGLHNYGDANRDRTLRQSWTYRLTRLVRGRIWITESGGIVGMRTRQHGRTLWPYSPFRAAVSLRHLLDLVRAPAVRRRYTRFYVYDFFGTWDRQRVTSAWDSGLVGMNGIPRPTYDIVRRAAAAWRRSVAAR
jgi:hypothetical protein